MNIKMVAVDLDGTLLNNQKAITNATGLSVANALNNGIEVVISTGRNYAEFSKLLRAVPDIRYAVTCTGASIVDCHTQKELFLSPLQADDVRALYATLSPFDLVFEVFVDGAVYISQDKETIFDGYMAVSRNPALAGSRTSVADFDSWLATLDRPAAKIHMFFHETAERDRAWEAVRALPYTILCSDELDLEIMAKGVDKGGGLKQLAGYLRLDRSQIMAVGDSLNDVGMLQYAGTCAVMANGLPELKQKADIVADTNEENGVAKLLDALTAGELTIRKQVKKINLQ